MIDINRIISRALVLFAVATMAACGGGGGGSPPAVSTGGGVVSGTAAKGILRNALVTAYCGVKSTSNAIGTATTGTDGSYSLTLTQSCTQPVEVVLSVVAGTTKMLDEIAGEINPPAAFTMSAIIANAGATVSQPITPFTDMAAAVVKNSLGTSNTLSASLVNNANNAIIINVLGGNAGLFTAQPLPPSEYSAGSTSTDQQKLIVLLSAISQAAQTATGVTTGDKVQAVLTQLADQAVNTFPSVTAASYSVSTTTDTPLVTISSGLTGLATADTTNLGAAASTIQSSATNIQTEVVQTSTDKIAETAGGTVETRSTAVQNGIEAARILVTAVRTNLLALVNTGETGFLNTKISALNSDANSLALRGTYSFGSILDGAYRATGFLAQTNQAVAAGGGSANAPAGSVFRTNAFGDFYQRTLYNGDGDITCSGYYTAGAGLTSSVAPTTRTAPISGNNGNPVVICNQYIFSGDNTRMMQFVVRSPDTKPTSGTNTFTYVNRIRTWAVSSCNNPANASCSYVDSNEVTGTLTATLDANLAVTSMAITNQPIIPYRGDIATTMSVNYTASKVNNVSTLTFTGGLTSGSLKYGFTTGSQLVLTDTSVGSNTSGSVAATLIGQIQTGAFQYDGTFNLSGYSANNTTTNGQGSFTGKISTMVNTVATPFLEGSLTASDATKTFAFSGKVTNGSSINSIAISGDVGLTGRQIAIVTILTPGYTFTATGINFDDPTVASTLAVTASDGTIIDVSRSNGSSTATVRNSAGTAIGSVSGNQMNFEDGSYILLN